MNITVFGASGGIGSEVVRQASRAGHSVTAVVRTSSPLPTFAPGELDSLGVRVVRVGGLTESDELVPAVTGADAVISCVGPRGPKDVTIASSATRAILAALQAAGVRRLIAVSAVPVGPVPAGESFVNRRIMLPLISRILRGIYGDLAVMEREIMDSSTQWTIVRPPRLVNGAAKGSVRVTIGGNVPRGRTIRRADVAAAMLSIVDDLAAVNRPVGVAR